MCCCRAHSQCSETTVFFVVAMAGWASAVPAGSHETSQLKAFKRVLDAHVEELRHLLHEFCSQEPGSFCLLDAIESQVSVALPEKPVSLAASAARFTSHEASGAVAFATGLASQAVQQARDEEPGIPGAAMHPRAAMHLKAAAMHLRVLEPSSVATAHEHMWQARQLETKRSHIGKAIKMVREVLTLQCLTACYDSQDGEAFDNAISVAFGKNMLGDTVRSQINQSKSKITRLGQEQAVFFQEAPKVWGLLESHDLALLWPAYAEASAIHSRPGRPKKPKPAKTSKVASQPLPSSVQEREAVEASTAAETSMGSSTIWLPMAAMSEHHFYCTSGQCQASPGGKCLQCISITELEVPRSFERPMSERPIPNLSL